ncbi:hypothetical protein [Absidia glauca]|uniref:RRM domain-containing protein n=1 Tax=Absidia glauca TaxID=4829 RepID=A0A163MV99_ABSGL|nr:hypothetical protein [Absidia glauca]
MSSNLDLALDDAIKDRRTTHRSSNSRNDQQRHRPSSSRNNSSNYGGGQRNNGGGIRKRTSSNDHQINSRLGGRQQNAGGPQRHIRRGKDSGGVSKRRNTDQPWSHDLFPGRREGGSVDVPIQSRLGGMVRPSSREVARSGTTLVVENLHYNVTEEDLENVFKLVGTVSKCSIEFDRSGRSTGQAKITFPEQDVAQKALDRFDNVDLDGQPMKITLSKKPVAEGKARRGGNSNTTRHRGTPNEADLDAELDAYTKNTESKDHDGDDMMMD